MATRSGLVSKNQLHPDAYTMVWAGLQSSDDGDWQLLAHYREKCFHVYGTWGGATLTLEGSNEDAPSALNAVPMIDYFQNAVTLGSNGMKRVMENPLYVRPKLTGGDGTTSLTANLVCRS